jgi:hypothetical protein
MAVLGIEPTFIVHIGPSSQLAITWLVCHGFKDIHHQLASNFHQWLKVRITSQDVRAIPAPAVALTARLHLRSSHVMNDLSPRLIVRS